MLSKGFFRVQPFNPKVIPETLIYQNTTPGNYSFTVPDKYNYVKIEIAGASGAKLLTIASNGQMTWSGSPGQGAIKTIQHILSSHIITGIIGQKPTEELNQSQYGGIGYHPGSNGTLSAEGSTFAASGGGGGGSTSVICNNILTTAGGGSGIGGGVSDFFNVNGGKGGDPYGGTMSSGTPTGTGSVYDGHNATDPGVTNFNSGGGYVKIWGGYNPDYD